MAVIYRITNMANGKFYIGSAESFARREWQHKYALRRNEHKNPRLQAAWNKYGEEMFVFEVIEEIAPDRNAFDIENTYLHKVVGQEDCYNINTDAIGMRTGITHTEASKAKVSASRKGKAAGEEHYRYGKIVSEEVRQKIGDTQRGKPKGPGRKVSEAGKAKIRANIEAGRSHMHWLGKTHTEEAKEKMRKKVLEQTSGQMFDSLTAVLTHYQMTMPTLRRALLSGKPISKGKFVGCVFVYA
jgi:group I intron endonuclease